MSKNSFTSKRILGNPVEPKFIKTMMKTELFKTSHQAGMCLILISISCWVIIAALGVSFFMKQQELDREVTLTKEALSQIDPILYNGIFQEETSADEPLNETETSTSDEILDETEETTLSPLETNETN